MNTSIHQLEASFTDTVGPAYLEKSFVPTKASLERWRYRSIVPLLHRLHGRITGLQCHQTTQDGQRIVWLEGGNPNGEPLLLLHGFGACKENWLPLLPFLWRRYKLFIPDLPGWGQSLFRVEARYSFDEQVAQIAAWAQAKLPSPVHIVGSSMGGGIAGLLAARHPQLIQSLTLLDAAGIAGNRITAFERGLLNGRNSLLARNFREVVELLDTTMASRYLPWLLAPFAQQDLISRYAVNQHLFRQMLEHAPDPAQPSYSAVSCPTLILWGDRDDVIDISCAQRYKSLVPQAEIHILRGVGHMPMVEAPRLTAKRLRRFLRAPQAHNANVPSFSNAQSCEAS